MKGRESARESGFLQGRDISFIPEENFAIDWLKYPVKIRGN